MRDIANGVLVDLFHINRHKLDFVPYPCDTVTAQGWLNKAIHSTDCTIKISDKIKYFKNEGHGLVSINYF